MSQVNLKLLKIFLSKGYVKVEKKKRKKKTTRQKQTLLYRNLVSFQFVSIYLEILTTLTSCLVDNLFSVPFGETEYLFLLNMVHPMNSLTQESEKIPWKTRKGVKDRLGHQALPKAAKCVTQRHPACTLPSKQSSAIVGRTELTNCNMTQDYNTRVAAVLANVMGSLAATISSVCCNHISRLLPAGVKMQELDSLNHRRSSNRKRRIQQIRKPLIVP